MRYICRFTCICFDGSTSSPFFIQRKIKVKRQTEHSAAHLTRRMHIPKWHIIVAQNFQNMWTISGLSQFIFMNMCKSRMALKEFTEKYKWGCCSATKRKKEKSTTHAKRFPHCSCALIRTHTHILLKRTFARCRVTLFINVSSAVSSHFCIYTHTRKKIAEKLFPSPHMIIITLDLEFPWTMKAIIKATNSKLKHRAKLKLHMQYGRKNAEEFHWMRWKWKKKLFRPFPKNYFYNNFHLRKMNGEKNSYVFMLNYSPDNRNWSFFHSPPF